jgi:hypothetical protein
MVEVGVHGGSISEAPPSLNRGQQRSEGAAAGEQRVLFLLQQRRSASCCIACTTRGAVLTVKFRQPSHKFNFGVGMSFISYPLVLTSLV